MSAVAEEEIDVWEIFDYLHKVEVCFQKSPKIYNEFVITMSAHLNREIDTLETMRRVSVLFKENRALLDGFNAFLPPGFGIIS